MTLILFGTLAIVMLVLLPAIARTAAIGAAILLAASLIDAWMIEPPYVELGVQIYLHDLIFILLALVGVQRLLMRAGLGAMPLGWYMFGLLLFSSLFLGLQKYGTTAGVDFRNFFYFFAGTVYFLSFSYDERELRALTKTWLVVCSILLGIVFFRWAAELAGLQIAQKWIAADPTGVKFRCIDSSQAYILGVGFVIMLYRFSEGAYTLNSVVFASLLAIAVIGLQHRSVWAVTAIAVLVLIFSPGVRGGKLAGKTMIMVILLGTILLPVLIYGLADVFLVSISDSAERATSLSTGTFGARVEGWKRLLSKWPELSVFEQAVGQPFGGRYGHSERSPHNGYIQLLYRVGAVGLFIFLASLTITVIKLFGIGMRRSNQTYSGLAFALLFGLVFYYIPYSMQPEHSIIFGMAISLARLGIRETKFSEISGQNRSVRRTLFGQADRINNSR